MESSSASGPAAGGDRPPGLRVGDWTLRYDTRQAWGPGGVEQRLTPKNLAVLKALAARAGETVTKEALLAENWPGRWPTEQVLARCIADLRRLFGDDPRSPTYIETIPKLGYRLIAPVGALPASAPGAAKPMPEPLRTGSWPRVAGIVALVVGAIAAAGYLSWSGGRDKVPVEVSAATMGRGDLRPETTGGGIETAVDYASTGAMAYARTLPDVEFWSIVLTDPDRASARVIDYAPDSLFSPVFSPAGERLALLRFTADGCSVNVTPLEVVNPHPLARCTSRFFTTIDWSPQGEWLAFTIEAQADESGRRALHLVDARTGAQRRLSAPPSSEHTDYNPRFSPEGDRVAFMRGAMSPQHHVDLYVATLSNGETRRLTFDETTMGGLDWISSNEIAFSSNRGGAWAIWVLNLEEASLRRLANLRVRRPTFDAARGVLAFTLSDWDRDLVRFRIDDAAVPVPLADSTRQEWQPDVSPDGATLVFVSDRSGHPELWRMVRGDGPAVRVTDLGGPGVAWPRVAGDTGEIAFVLDEGVGNVVILGDRGEVMAPSYPWPETTTPAWRPESASLALGCRVDGEWRVCGFDPATGDHAVLTPPNTYHPQYSGDGRWLYFVDGAAALWRQPANGGAAELVAHNLPSQSVSAWRVWGEDVLLLDAGGDDREPGLYRLAAGARQWRLQRAMPVETVNASLAMDAGGEIIVSVMRPVADDIVSFVLPGSGRARAAP